MVNVRSHDRSNAAKNKFLILKKLYYGKHLSKSELRTAEVFLHFLGVDLAVAKTRGW